jgi:anionic cell wall polymer biosynthesis LytR-Cps2A-Psr (LCP) family protein
VGALQIEFPAATRDQSSGLEVGSGCQALDGDQVLALARARHLQTQEPDGSWRNDPNSDLSRMARQRAVLIAALRGLQGESLNPLRVDQLVGAVADRVVVDAEFSLAQLASTVSWLHDLPTEAITQGAVPVRAHTTPDGASVLLPVEGFEAYVRSLLDDEVEPPSIVPSDGGFDGASVDPLIAPC